MRQTGQPGLSGCYIQVRGGVSPEGGPAAPCLLLPSQHWSPVTGQYPACLSPGKEGALGKEGRGLLRGSHGVWRGGLTWPERRRRLQSRGS